MIGRLSGTLIEKHPPFLLIDVGGVGYECQAPMNTIYQLPEVGGKVVLHTHLSVSENAHALFAFYTQQERRLFRELIKVSGVGPKLALAILSAMSAGEFVGCVHQGEASVLVKIPGVGKKTAERLIVEMRDRLKDWQGAPSPSPAGSTTSGPVTNDSVQEAISALVALGYKPAEASKAIARVGNDTLPVASLIREALKAIA